MCVTVLRQVRDTSGQPWLVAAINTAPVANVSTVLAIQAHALAAEKSSRSAMPIVVVGPTKARAVRVSIAKMGNVNLALVHPMPNVVLVIRLKFANPTVVNGLSVLPVVPINIVQRVRVRTALVPPTKPDARTTKLSKPVKVIALDGGEPNPVLPINTARMGVVLPVFVPPVLPGVLATKFSSVMQLVMVGSIISHAAAINTVKVVIAKPVVVFLAQNNATAAGKWKPVHRIVKGMIPPKVAELASIV